MPLAGLLYPEDLRYRPEPDFPSGSAAENLRNLVRYSAVSICTYTASFCMSFAMLCRTKWNQYVPAGIAALRRYFGREKAAEQRKEAKSIRKCLRTGEHNICRRFRFRKSEERDQRKV